MIIRYSGHATRRLQLRKISEKNVEWSLIHSANRYYDIETRNLIAIAQVSHQRKIRWMMVAYQEMFGENWVVTAHPISQAQIQNRIHRGRWVRI